jgi:ankyrin repeat protein
MANTSTSYIFHLINTIPDENALLEKMETYLTETHAKAKDESDRTALHLLAAKGYAKAVEKLIEAGAVVDAPSRFGTPLEIGIKGGHLGVTKILVSRQANLLQQDKEYFSPLHWAAKTPDASLALKLVHVLIKEGVDVDIQGGNRVWPIHIAVERGEIALVKKLLSDKVINAKSSGGKTALQLAYEHGHEEIASLLMKQGADINCNHGPDGKKLIDWAAEHHQNAVVELLLEKGANVKDCYQLLFWASKNDRPVIVKNVIDATLWQGPDSTSAKGWTALDYAAFSGSVESVKLLLAAGAKVNHQDKFGHSSLELAAYKGHTEIAKLLVEKGALVNIQSSKGYTPLMEAIKKNHMETAGALENLGADWNVQDKNDWTAYHWAQHVQDSFSMPTTISLECMEEAPSSDHLDMVDAAFERGEW